MFPRLGLTCVALLALAACGGGEDAVSTTLPLPPETVATLPAETTDVEPAETTAGPTTNPTPTTSSTTTSTTTTEPFNEPSDLAAAIERDLQAGDAALLQAGTDPSSAESRASIERYFSGRARDSSLEFLAFLVGNGLVTQLSSEVAPVIMLTSGPILVDDSGTRAEAETCRVDSTVVVEPPPTPGAEPIIFNDEVLRTVAVSRFNLEDGVWKLDGGTLVQDTLGATTCPAI